MKPCLWPGCPEYVGRGHSYCPPHARRRQQLDFTGGVRSANEYRRNRELVLRQQRYLCATCGAHATAVHHRGRADDDSIRNLVGLCDACHAAAHGRRY